MTVTLPPTVKLLSELMDPATSNIPRVAVSLPMATLPPDTILMAVLVPYLNKATSLIPTWVAIIEGPVPLLETSI